MSDSAALQASLSFIISWSLLKLMFVESLILSAILSFVTPFSSCPQSFPESGSFPVSALHIKGTKYWLRICYTPTILMALQGLYHLTLSTSLWNVYCCYLSSLSGKFSNKLIHFPKSQLMLNAGKNFSPGTFAIWYILLNIRLIGKEL